MKGHFIVRDIPLLEHLGISEQFVHLFDTMIAFEND